MILNFIFYCLCLYVYDKIRESRAHQTSNEKG